MTTNVCIHCGVDLLTLAVGQVWVKTIPPTRRNWIPQWRKITRIYCSYNLLFVSFIEPRSPRKLREYQRRAADVQNRIRLGYPTTSNTNKVLCRLRRTTDHYTVEYRLFQLWVRRNTAKITVSTTIN